ncbi:MAG: 3-phosphoshikimate 1-carboxyvinyltransferase [Actinobacteria bacterium]|nr:3-phosphoshikimate 1-carboxyvinyltransferase [Actinomycetota bacterium]MCG2819911.1 3-phosphoshikimate 1-carboxyvinyltransferase [Actinomycetes bacterium]MBU4179663.1 3-phosphoshikimate 1-carboxyvinyltransferase [Actinomycetota bacterium]MBU4219000.1 3-phosphoshikimate 1-carboxyvinyltransferase [Actinomycetota bacterium]MBU4359188.1 3-phosphoshikimate 1-carboxyvinyltransferase [Actinomycetota bacterium]
MRAAFEKSELLRGEVAVPGDKSISHRAAIVGAVCRGGVTARGFSPADDCSSTCEVLRELGVRVDRAPGRVLVEGRGDTGLEQPVGALDAGNSGTTMRLLAGVLAARPMTVTLTGDDSLRKRPMTRIIEPLRMMGATITGDDAEGHPPLKIQGGALDGIEYSQAVPSAQVKSAILLAGLGASGRTVVREKIPTRDHTERLLERMGIEVVRRGLSVEVEPGVPSGCDLDIPGDLSSAAFVITLALICPKSDITVRSVGLNPTRTGFLDLVRRMGADILVDVEDDGSWEPVGDIRIRHSSLEGIELTGEDVAGAIDEVTLVALLATQAKGRTVIRGAAELRHKESDRIGGTVLGLSAMGADIRETEDGMVIEGGRALTGADVSPDRDHRLAMMFAVAGMAAAGRTIVSDWECSDVSYPGFLEAVRGLGGRAFHD